MSDRRTYFFRQKVQADELNAGFTGLENADHAIATDQGIVGVCFGMGVTQNVAPALNVLVAGPGAAYDDLGQRIGILANQLVNCAVDASAASTAVVTPGNEKIISVVIDFQRLNSDPRIDGNSTTVYFVNQESFRLRVIQGAEGVHPATPPAIPAHSLLLADITLIFGQTTIVNANISITRRNDIVSITSVNLSPIRTGTLISAFAALVADVDAFVSGSAAAIGYGGGAAWADGTTNPATNVEAQLDKIINDLAGATGTGKLFGAAHADSPNSLTAARLDTQMAQLLSFINDRLRLEGGVLIGAVTPNVTGVGLGDTGHRFNAWLNTLNVAAALTVAGNIVSTAATLELGDTGHRFNTYAQLLDVAAEALMGSVVQHPTAAQLNALHRTNLIRAWGVVDVTNTLLTPRYNIASMTHPGTGIFHFTLDQAPANFVVLCAATGGLGIGGLSSRDILPENDGFFSGVNTFNIDTLAAGALTNGIPFAFIVLGL